MTYLEICQAALGSTDTGAPKELISLADANQYQSQVTGFVAEAWRFIQTLHEEWGWRRLEFTFQMLADRGTYKWNEMRDPAGARVINTFRGWIGLKDDWYLSTPANNHESPVPISPVTFETMRRFLFQPSPSRSPSHFSIYPDKTLVLHPAPDDTYRIHGIYTPGVQILKNENDVPLGLTEDYHDLIKWRAVMMLQAFDEADASYGFAEQSYKEMLRSLGRLYLPEVVVGGALA